MSLVVVCASCGKRFQAGPKARGQTIPCPHCRQPIFVPTEEHAGELDLGGAPAPAPLVAPVPRPAPATPAPRPANAPYGPVAGPPGNSPYGFPPGGAPVVSPYRAAPPNAAPPAPALPPTAPLDALGYGSTTALPTSGGARFKKIKPPPEWYANPMVWAAALVPVAGLVLLIFAWGQRMRANGAASRADSTAAATADPSGAAANNLSPTTAPTTSPLAASDWSGGPAPSASPASTVAAPSESPAAPETVAPPEEEGWRAQVDPPAMRWSDVEIAFGPKAPRPFFGSFALAPNTAPFAASHEAEWGGRVAIWDLITGQRIAEWGDWPRLYGAEALDATGRVFAHLKYARAADPENNAPAVAGELIVATVGGARVRTPVSWPDAPHGAASFLAFAGSDLVTVAPNGTAVERWTAGPDQWTRVARTPGRWPKERHCYAVSPGGRYLVAFDDSRHLVAFALTRGEEVGRAVEVELPSCGALTFSLDGAQVAGVIDHDPAEPGRVNTKGRRSLAVWDFATGRRLGLHPLPQEDLQKGHHFVQPFGRGWVALQKYVVTPEGSVASLNSAPFLTPAVVVNERRVFAEGTGFPGEAMTGQVLRYGGPPGLPFQPPVAP